MTSFIVEGSSVNDVLIFRDIHVSHYGRMIKRILQRVNTYSSLVPTVYLER